MTQDMDRRVREYTGLGGGKGSRQATALRLAGASWQDIAEVLDFSSAALAKNAVMQDLAQLATDEDAKQTLREVEGERLNRILRGLWQKATDPNNPEHLNAAGRALSVIDRRIKLYGLDAPSEVVVHSPTTAEIDAYVSKLLALQTSDVIEGEVIEDF